MKIFRSPIEPDFIAYLKFSWRIKRARFLAQIKRSFSALAVFYKSSERKLGKFLRGKIIILTENKNHLRERFLSHVNKVRKEAETPPSVRLSTRTQTAREMGQKVSALLKSHLSRSFFLALLVVGFTVGWGVKIWAQDTFTIGFEDFKTPASTQAIDLNAVQERVLKSGGSLTLTGTSLVGEQCTE